MISWEPRRFATGARVSSGKLIAFEGIDGSGKSTQAKKFADWLESLGREVVRTREPTNGPWGRKIREARFTARLSPEDELNAFIEDRRQHVGELLNPSLARGAVVVIDRYYYSTVAYQGARGLDSAELFARNRAFAPKPDLVVLVDVEPSKSLERINARGEGQDLFESLGELTAVRQRFLAMASEPHVTVVDGSGAPEVVFGRVLLRTLAGPLREWVSARAPEVVPVLDDTKLNSNEKAEKLRAVLNVD